MPSPDYTPILTQIRTALNEAGESKTASQLIREVRESIRAIGQPTVRDSLVELRNAITSELTQIRNVLTGGAGVPAGGRPVMRPEDKIAGQHLPEIEKDLRERITELTRAVTVLSEIATRGSGGIPGLGGATTFDTAAYSRRIDSVRDLVERSAKSGLTTADMLQQALTAFRGSDGILVQQYSARQKDAVFGLVSLATKTTDLIYIFERLSNFIKTNIVEKYSGYMANRAGNVSAEGYFFDEFKRIFDSMTGRRAEVGYGIVDTNESIKRAIQSGLTSPMLMYGQNVEQLSATYRQMITDLEKRGANPRAFGSPDQLQALFNTVTEMKNAVGGANPFQQMRAQGSIDIQTNMLIRLADIAKNTGLSADKLIELVKAATQEASELSALGLLSEREAQNFTTNKAILEALGPSGKQAGDLASKYLASGRNPAAFYANNPEMAKVDSMSGGALTSFLSRISDLLVSDKDLRTQIPEIRRAAQQEGAGLKGYLGNLGMMAQQVSPQAGALGGMVSRLANIAPELAEAPGKVGMIDRTAQTIEDLAKQYPIFSGAVAGFGGLMLQFGMHVAEFAVAARMLGILGGGAAAAGAGGGLLAAGSGALGYYAKVAGGTLARAAPVLGGVVGAGTAAIEGSSGAGIAGAGIGGAIGAYGGMALGSMIGPVGTAIGGVVGSYLGSWLGQKAGEFVSPATSAPAVAPPQNVAGPAAAAVAGVVDTQRSYQDDQIRVLSGLLSATVDGNGILNQMYSELSRQTGYLTGTQATSSTPQLGAGLTVNTPAVANAGRPNPGTPYAGAGM